MQSGDSLFLAVRIATRRSSGGRHRARSKSGYERFGHVHERIDPNQHKGTGTISLFCLWSIATAAASGDYSKRQLKMYNRILVAVDESDTSNLALKEAINLAKDQHSTLRLVHVVDLTPAYTDVEAPYAAEYQKALQAAGQKLIESYSSLAREAQNDFGSKLIAIDTLGRRIRDAIEEEVKQWQADLIVIGTHGRRGVRRLLRGSVAEGVARVASEPVLLVRGIKA